MHPLPPSKKKLSSLSSIYNLITNAARRRDAVCKLSYNKCTDNKSRDKSTFMQSFFLGHSPQYARENQAVFLE